jgi:hypothetical protein
MLYSICFLSVWILGISETGIARGSRPRTTSEVQRVGYPFAEIRFVSPFLSQTTPLSVYFVDTIFPLFGQTNLWHALHWSVGHVPIKTFVRLFCRHKFSTFWSNQLVACLALVCGSRAHKDYFASSTLKFKIAKKTLGIFLGRKPTTNLLSISFSFWY